MLPKADLTSPASQNLSFHLSNVSVLPQTSHTSSGLSTISCNKELQSAAPVATYADWYGPSAPELKGTQRYDTDAARDRRIELRIDTYDLRTVSIKL